MSHEIIKNIFVTADRRVIVCHAPGNIQPQIFHEEEYEPLTELLRKEGYERLEEEILYLFFLGVWQNAPFDECEHAAAYIRRKVRDEGAHYRDFVIAARDIGPYSASLAMAMGRYDIPMFLADKPDLLSRPPMALVIGALESVRSNFGCRELFGCLKTGLTGLAWDEIDRLENYAITWKIHGAAWERDWVEHPDGYGIPVDEAAQMQLDELNELRARAIAPFAALRERLKGVHHLMQ